ncbi:MAG: PAS domain S-box protein [Betaproteobacteria bacterium]|nr:PAS domain S-box protein [Betaproteobacteria bacterium]
MQKLTRPGSRWVIRTNYVVRAASFATLFVAIGMHMAAQNYAATAWTLLAAQFLVYPHVLFWRTRISRQPLRAEMSNLILDCLVLGVWAAALGFPAVIAFTMFMGVSLDNAIYRGWRGALQALIVFSCGALGWMVFGGSSFSPDTELSVTVLSLACLSAYVISIGTQVFARNSELHVTREELRKSEQKYRLITENAGDLIALLDAEGRWVYASPSYRSLLPGAALEIGASALAQIHPEDREMVRARLKEAMQTGESQEFLYRLVTEDGAAHEFEATANAFSHAGVRRTVVVSIDITELRQREKALAIQAHAFENMAEGMMITTTDGTILSINKAFTAVTGYSKEEVLGKQVTEFHTALQPAKFYDDIREAVSRHGRWAGTTWSRRKDNSIYRERRSVSAIMDEAGHTTHYIAFVAVAGDAAN